MTLTEKLIQLFGFTSYYDNEYRPGTPDQYIDSVKTFLINNRDEYLPYYDSYDIFYDDLCDSNPFELVNLLLYKLAMITIIYDNNYGFYIDRNDMIEHQLFTSQYEIPVDKFLDTHLQCWQ